MPTATRPNAVTAAPPQGVGTLEVFDAAPKDQVYPDALQTFDNLSRVVDTLFARSTRVVA